MRFTNLIPVITGPTAVGKTAAAVVIAQKIGAEIISADSRQFYRGLEIGTGAPSAEELTRVPHHFVSFLEPHERSSAGEFASLARVKIKELWEKDVTPMIVGGSGLYIRALIDGLSPIPKPDPELRNAIREEIDNRGTPAMIEELQSVDPVYAGKVGVNDRKRLVRALEVYRMTGKSFTEWRRIKPSGLADETMLFCLNRPRPELHKIIEKRIGNMIELGWIQEVKRLIDKYGSRTDLPKTVLEGLGYREITAYIAGEINLEEAVERTIISTRQFAKRQITWFKAEERMIWLESSGDNACEEWISAILKKLI